MYGPRGELPSPGLGQAALYFSGIQGGGNGSSRVGTLMVPQAGRLFKTTLGDFFLEASTVRGSTCVVPQLGGPQLGGMSFTRIPGQLRSCSKAFLNPLGIERLSDTCNSCVKHLSGGTAGSLCALGPGARKGLVGAKSEGRMQGKVGWFFLWSSC